MNPPRFNYLRDGMFLLGCLCYTANQLVFKRWSGSPLLHDHFNDFFLIPCALPPLLLLHRWLGWRPRAVPPSPGEVLGHLALWSVLIEGIGPHFVSGATGDWWDVMAYAAGAAVALAWWWRDALRRRLLPMDVARA